MEPEVFIIVAVVIAGCLAAFLYLLGARVITRARLWQAEVEAKQIENARLKASVGLISPGPNGSLPAPVELLRNGISVDQYMAYIAQLVEANKIHPMPPQHLTYAPHTSADRSLDITGAPGLNQATGGGTYTLLDAIDQDIRFGMAIPKRNELEDDYADA
jgi:hypothetical protein